MSPKPVGIRLDNYESVAPKLGHLVPEAIFSCLVNKSMALSHSGERTRELSDLQEGTTFGLLGGYLSNLW